MNLLRINLLLYLFLYLSFSCVPVAETQLTGVETKPKPVVVEPKPKPADFSLQYEWSEGTLPPPYHYEYTLYLGPGSTGVIEFWPDYPNPGTPGMPGSKYRLVPKTGNMVLIATVIARDLPREFRLSLDASNVVVSATDEFIALSSEMTKLISEEVFSFKGLFNKAFGFLAQGKIKAAHRQHMEAFKRFAENDK